ncbi:MAG: DUF2232 domain-containing protein [Jatrophihabitans sp.]
MSTSPITAERPVLAAPGRARWWSRGGPLRPRELAEAAAMADVSAALCIATWLLPFSGVSYLLAAFPFAVLAHRHRIRVSLTALLAGGVVGLLIGGQGVATTVVTASVLGAAVGTGLRRRWSPTRTVAASLLTVGVPAAVLATGLLGVFPSYRRLLFAQLRNSWDGTRRLLKPFHLGTELDSIDRVVTWALAHWWVLVPAGVLLSIAFAVLLTCWAFRWPLRVVAGGLPSSADPALPIDAGAQVAPLPLRLADVAVRYPGAARSALAGMGLDLDPGEFLAVTGPNGAGKSTLARVIAGWEPTSGTVSRPGSSGLGRPGGTTIVFQRPDSQVLGVRVADDLAWGAPLDELPDVDALLDRVGLTGFAQRETATLSGGELQRLAVATALARRPAVFISDESTAMIDVEGRAGMVELFRSISQQDGTTVVHVTHDVDEARQADRQIRLQPADAASRPEATPQWFGPDPIPASRGGDLRLVDVGFAHDAGTPWEHSALSRVNLEIPAGQAILLTGANGAGKSTLAGIMSGLFAPTTGQVLLDGESLQNGRAGAVIGFQHSRLQLLRPTVREDIRDAAGIDDAEADDAMRLLGLDPARFGARKVDELSGGEQRRVVLAGLLACRPRVLVLDEPLAGLDVQARSAMADALRLVQAEGTTLVIVSHDDELDELAHRTYAVADGRIAGAPAIPTAGQPVRGRRPTLPAVAGRVLPRVSTAHRLWVGTKLGTIIVLAALFAIRPSWLSVAAALVTLLAWAVAGRVPQRAIPRLPSWMLGMALLGAVLAGAAGGKPDLHLGAAKIGLHGLDQWALFMVITLLSILASLLFSWTTAPADIPPFLQRLTNAFRRVRVPAAAPLAGIAIALRLGPLLLTECRTLLLVSGQRTRCRPAASGRRRRQLLVTGWDLLTLLCTLACRRAGELAEAIAARGGLGSVALPDKRPGRADLLAALFVAAVVTASILI